MILFVLTCIFLFIRCGYPCAHVLKATNELTLEMIKVQHWKLYATGVGHVSMGQKVTLLTSS
jgi:hypothetical protein